ncbi:WecB/TagA/CpsF family glycosyltransferase [Fredinandcohnia sp. 179-A 10B2 NHS]|uniref:WecB/TagA/CpsF family glycosyltransferase n=1 Tax=Fredinandcohnia sp. 179-A 10B2 NHS TaxID=3235176 RepID=UPI0039A148F4
MKNKVDILGVEFINTTLLQLVNTLTTRLKNEEKTFIVTANPEIVMQSIQDEEYKKALDSANMVIADGIGVVIASKILQNPLPERVAGYDLMLKLLEVANNESYKVYLLGAEETVLAKTISNIEKQYENVQIVGSHHGFFDSNNIEISNQIKDLQPDLVFVALGVPRQEKWIYQNLKQMNKGIFIGVGGSFDVIAGNVKRAPEIWQKLNLEWFYRLVKQPSRWKRMLALPQFIIKVILKKFKG